MTTDQTPTPESATTEKAHNDFIVVGIGASAGGIKALKELFRAMPPDPKMAFVVVLHLSPSHESNLAAVLQSETQLPVLQVNETTKVRLNHVYVIPPNRSLMMVDGSIQTAALNADRGTRTAIDLFFRTLSQAYGSRAVGVVLSGTGSDGTQGLKIIKGRSGFAVVQQPEDAEYDGMPRSAIATNLIDVVLPARDIPEKLLAVRDSTERFNLITSDEAEVTPELKNAQALHEILTILRVRTGHDFSNYKQPTLLRRIARHLQIHDIEDMGTYVDFLREHPDEIRSLLHNLLINVTNFFRDQASFQALEQDTVPRLFEGKGPQDQIRVWVAGCASGEEAYSIGMLLLERAATTVDAPKIQIFASDVDEDAIAQARDARYTEAIETDVSAERLQQFFTREGNRYRVKKHLREIVLFAPHNVLRDPPFSRLDLISCRNLMIYLNRPTQEKLLHIFHFALRPNGFLFLGSSESAEAELPLFSPHDKKNRIYIPEKTAATIGNSAPIMPVSGRWEIRLPELEHPPYDLRLSYGELHYKLIEHYAAPSVLTNEEFDIQHLSQSAGRYLRFTGGEPTANLLKLVHPDLLPDVRSGLFTAQHENKEVETQNVSCEIDSKRKFIKLTVRPVAIHEMGQRFFLVLFDDSQSQTAPSAPAELPVVTLAADGAMESVVRRLEEELRRTKDRLRLTIEQHETSIEELKASNEELQAINEELRSATEELETSKEELQSVNEELSTVNTELKGKVDEVSRANSDLQNLMSSSDIGTIFLDRNLRIKRFTPHVKAFFNIIPSDIGRPLEHLTHRLKYRNFSKDSETVLKSLHKIEREIECEDGQTFLLRYLPYRTTDDRIDGVVLTFVDVTERNAAAESLLRAEARFRVIVNQVTTGVAETNLQGRFVFVNQRFCEITGYAEAELMKLTVQEVTHTDDLPQTTRLFEQMLKDGKSFEIEKRYLRKDGHEVWVHNSVTIISDRDGIPHSAVAVVLDINERKRTEEYLRETSRRKDNFLAILSHELRNPLAPLQNGLTILRRSFDRKDIAEKTLQIMERQLHHIVHLVDDLLDISRISHGKITLRKEHFELKAAIDLALDTVWPMLKEHGLELHVDLPPEPVYLYMDMGRVAQIISNLLTNAVKYNCPEGHIWISARTDGNSVAIHVRNTGIGISAAALPKIFDQFSPSEAEGKSGLGIGLHLVKTLVEMQGGNVQAFSAGHEQGAEMVVRLPLDEQPSKSDAPILDAGTEETAKRQILIVDDNMDTANTLADLLTDDGHTTRSVYSGKSAIAMAEQFKPEIAILDIGMPNMNGLELAEALRRQLPDILLIAMSGWGQEADLQRSKAAGFAAHLVKPVQLNALSELLKGLPVSRKDTGPDATIH